MGDLDGDPERRDGGNCPRGAHENTAKYSEYTHVKGLGQAEQKEQGPAEDVADAAVKRETELDPVADPKPINDARHVAEQEAALGPRLACDDDEQRGKRERRQPRDVETRDGQDKQQRSK